MSFYEKDICEECGAFATCKTPKIGVLGKGGKRILIVGEAPTKKEDDLSDPLCNTASLYLKDALELVDVDLENDCWFVHATQCKPNSGGPSTTMINHCRQVLHKEIKKLKPRVVITLGQDALKVLIGDKTSGRANFTPFSKWVGWVIPDQDLETFVCPLNSPRYVLSEYKNPVIERKFVEGLDNAVKDRSFYKTNYQSEVFVTLDEQEAIKWMGNLLKKDTLAFDYETTGLKPQRAEQRILCVSFSDGLYAWSFPIFDTVEFHTALMRVLKSKRIRKVCANMYFEYIWTKQKLNYEINNMYFDTVLAAHVLDNRDGITGLKFQSYVRTGILGYDDSVDHYMKKTKEGEDKKSNNRLNCLDVAPIDELCTYCAMDSLLTMKIYEAQIIELKELDVERGYRLLHDSTLALADIHFNGLKIDEAVLDKNIATLDSMIGDLSYEIMADPVLAKWDGEEQFNYNSTKQMAHFLFDILGYTPTKFTTAGAPSTDKESLEAIPEEFVQKYLKMKKLEKLKTTYLLGTKREVVDGYIHPFIGLNAVKSYRASSQSPNYQNLPSHDKFAREMVLSPIVPRNDFIVAVDMTSWEVGVAYTAHKDPQMLEFLLDPKLDMHKRVGTYLFLCEESEVTKDMRQISKQAVFSLQYGAGVRTIAERTWKKDFTKEMKSFLSKRGIRNYKKYYDHVSAVVDKYWNELFSEYGKWCKANWDTYLTQGYLQSPLGLRYTTIMSYTNALNYASQGTAANLTLFSLTQINKYIKENKLKSKCILTIHDSIEWDVAENEYPELREVIKYWMGQGLKDTFPWLICPVRSEAEFSYNNYASVEHTEQLADVI
jgi:DNA polymerase-1